MKRINKIEIENARAYYDRLTIKLDKGENLLLYGENGSGKTSLYKALYDFIQSFYKTVSYKPNRYKPESSKGEVVLSIGDYDAVTNQLIDVKVFSHARSIDNLHVENTAFMKALALSRGFLNYRDLLKVYLYEEKDPNLFEFFVTHLLGNHVPVAQGRSTTIKNEWDELNLNLFEVHDRRTNQHRLGLYQLADFEVMLRSVLNNLMVEVNRYLEEYFDNFELALDYDLKPLEFRYHRRKWQWEVVQDLRLKVTLNDSDINDYIEGLNEARLSAIAICLYLAALRANPGSDLRLMFLDDIFIGIDSSNRLPILRVLDNEFKDFQIIIATYDRSWYCMAKSYITSNAAESWKFANLFSLPKTVGGQTFPVPVMTDGQSAFDRAKEYLHGRRDIDLPAAANYFRKTLEELFLRLPKELFLSDDYTVIPGFKLTQRTETVRQWFDKIGVDKRHVSCVESFLHPLIHPLSHYDEEAQIYRNEMLKVEEAIRGLVAQVEAMPQKCRLLLGKGNVVCIQFNKSDDSYKSKYFLMLDENLWLYKDDAGIPNLANCKCRMTLMEGEKNGAELAPFIPSRKTIFNYPSIDEALQQIYDHEVNSKHNDVQPCTDYDKVFFTREKKVTTTCIRERRDEILAAMT